MTEPAGQRADERAAELAAAVHAWIAGDPDPVTRAELAALPPADWEDYFGVPLTFGTAGLRGPVRGGPAGMNVAVVTRTTWALGTWLLAGSPVGTPTVVLGRDARHGSEAFFQAALEVLTALGISVVPLPEPGPTPWVAFGVKHIGATAGIQITASHNPRADNGYKVYVADGAQLAAPADKEIEALIRSAPPANAIARQSPHTAHNNPGQKNPGQKNAADSIPAAYLDRIVARSAPAPRPDPISNNRPLRIALTPMHGVGGAVAVEALNRCGFTDVSVVEEQFAPDPDFPTAPFPNPEEPGATDLLLALAERIDADIAIALDPDADRCAVGVPTPDGWRMLTGDQTGCLVGDFILATRPLPLGRDTLNPNTLVASSLVSSTMLARIASGYGVSHTTTLTGFKNLARAGDGLVFAYEEALGLCVDPDAVADKDGISAAVVAAAMARRGPLWKRWQNLIARVGDTHTGQVSVRRSSQAELSALMTALRDDPPLALAGYPVTMTDLADSAGPLRTDAVVFAVGSTTRVLARPSGTEPKVKFYIEADSAADLGKLTSAVSKLLT